MRKIMTVAAFILVMALFLVACGKAAPKENEVSVTDINSEDESDETEEEPEQTTTDANKVEVIPGQHRDPNSAVVVIDPGHQLNGDSTKEPNGPGSFGFSKL